MSSQSHEDEFIVKYFNGKIGTFVDVGANDGIKYCNTRCLYDLGWNGICVEPDPTTYEALVKNYTGQSRVKTLHAAVTIVNEDIEFWTDKTHYCSGWSSLVPRWVNSMQGCPTPGGETVFEKVTVKGITMDTILAGLHHVDFLTIDTEGHDADIIKSMSLTDKRPTLIMVEHDKWTNLVDIVGKLYSTDYRLIWANTYNAAFEDRRTNDYSGRDDTL